jgi:DNA polymerase/3'-5' exonuclease PolX
MGTSGQTKGGSGSGKVTAYGGVVKPSSQYRGKCERGGRAASPREPVSSGMLSGLRFHFPHGKANLVQVASLKKFVRDHGGVVLEKLTADVTHVVTEVQPETSLVTSLLELMKVKPVVCVKPNWLGQCAFHERVVPLAEDDLFVIQAPPSPAASQRVTTAAIFADDAPSGGAAVLKLDKREQSLQPPHGGHSSAASEDGSEDEDGSEEDNVPRRFNLACQPGAPAPSVSVEVVNFELESELKKLAEILKSLPEVPGNANGHKSNVFGKLAKDVASLNFLIDCPAAASKAIRVLQLKSTSSRAKLLAEFGRTGICQRLQSSVRDPRIKALSELSQVHGVSGITAGKLVCSGITSIRELRKRVQSDIASGNRNRTLTESQLLGLDNMEDLLKSMPREEVEEIRDVVSRELQLVCPGAELHIAGSYRRGKLYSNDVDCLITCSDSEKKPADLLADLVNRLGTCGLLRGILSQSSKENEPCAQCFALCRVRSTVRRIDLKVYPPDLMPYALLYFTGSAHFNRSMRYYAKRRGWSLSDKGLVPAIGSGDDRVKGTNTVPAASEEAIFKALDLVYVPPEARNV